MLSSTLLGCETSRSRGEAREVDALLPVPLKSNWVLRIRDTFELDL